MARPRRWKLGIFGSLALVMLLFGALPAGAIGGVWDDYNDPWVFSSLPYSDVDNTGFATIEPWEPAASCRVGADSHSVWYRYTPAANVQITANTIGSDYDTVLAVYRNNWSTEVACNDDIGGGVSQSEVTFIAYAGSDYYFRVSEWDVPGAGGNLHFNVTGTSMGPANDNFAGAAGLGTGTGVTNHTNVGATTQSGEQLSCGFATMGSTTWYSMTVGANSNVTVSTRGADFDTVLAVYTGAWGSLTRVTCDDDINAGADRDSEVAFAGVPGVTYWIQVGGFSGATGHYPVNIARTPTGAGVTCRGQAATIVGTAGDDTLNGTAGADVIAGLGGNDEIHGLGGNDVICAGGGADDVWGGLGADVIVGQPGNDSIWGQGGNDQLFGNGGADYLHGGIGTDTLQGGVGADTCVAGEVGTC